MSFSKFGKAVSARAVFLAQSPQLFRVNISGDELWDLYLASFPEGTNPIFRVRTEHDGSYDKNFIRRLGGVVRLEADGSLSSIWDVEAEYPYDVVAARLKEAVESASILSLFATRERTAGHLPNIEVTDTGTLHWEHFYAEIPNHHVHSDAGAVIGAYEDTVTMLDRALREFQPEHVQMVLDLIADNDLYRGAEYKGILEAFQKLQTEFLATNGKARATFARRNSGNRVARIRSNAIAMILKDLADGKDFEIAVKGFETAVAGPNYKRPKAVFSQRQIDQALATIAELGLEPSLSRRHATLEDVSVTDVLWSSAEAQSRMKGGLAGLLTPTVKETGKATDIAVDDFMKLLPGIKSMEVLLKNPLKSNLVTLTAPEYEGTEPLFSWGNDFAWSYNGDITDSIAERVKAAGGSTEGKLRVSLAWSNPDDLDIHAHTPFGHIYHGDKMGILDVDMNAYGKKDDFNPVENMNFTKVPDGTYSFSVQNYNKRLADRVGFTLEVAYNGQVQQFSHASNPRHGERVNCLTVIVKNGEFTIRLDDKGITGGSIPQEIWGLTTETFVPVETLMLSPNFWGHNQGNKHWFFFLSGCKNPDPVRGIYNEFLRSDLHEHRRVFEMLGARTKCEYRDNQLSGLGFSSTKRADLTVRADGRLYNVKF